MERREFLKSLANVTAGLMLPVSSFAAKMKKSTDRLGDLLPTRALGNTGERVTMLGLGGWHIGGKMDEAKAQTVIEVALEGGVRFFDTAESYQRGESERRYGKFLTPKYRDVVFLMSKTTGGDAGSVRSHLEGTLKRLNTDYLDLWQVHSLQNPEDVDGRIENGVLEVMQEVKASGKARHIGFTGHRSPSAHVRMLERTKIFETCQMPINLLDPSYESFIEQVLPVLVERKMGVLAMKTLSNGRFFQELIPDRVSVAEAIQFVWSLPVSVLITGPDNRAQLTEKIKLAHAFQEMGEKERQALVVRVADLAGTSVEYYKA
ncbi:MAG: aldo/keto reductase [bacterium]|nr:aldo/keto reductase [bacterium]